jgi:predicted unusual protein kinase regulating ubiquinone biosynthesis (AarF/ABC1/UbiB family)
VLGGCGGYVEPQLVFLDHGRYIVLPDPMRQRYCQLWCSFIANDARTMREVATGIAGTCTSECRRGAQPVRDSMAVVMPSCVVAVWRRSRVHKARARNS